jgi:hypothetical protein
MTNDKTTNPASQVYSLLGFTDAGEGCEGADIKPRHPQSVD